MSDFDLFEELSESEHTHNDYYLCNMLINEAIEDEDIELLKEALKLRMKHKELDLEEKKLKSESSHVDMKHRFAYDVEEKLLGLMHALKVLLVHYTKKEKE